MTGRTRSVDPDIRRAATIASRTYFDPASYEVQRERVFAPAWHYVGDADRLKAPGHVLPFTLLEGCLDEPLFLSRGEDGRARCFSNVCTHRGAVLIEGESHERALRCRYHGRKFDLCGRFQSMPEFDDAEDFPRPEDDLPRLELEQFGPMLFSSLAPAASFDAWIGPVRERMTFFPLDDLVFDSATSREYTMSASWALYVDNYLEEFHIPYIHARSLTGLDYEAYRTERFEWGNVQIGAAKQGESTFDLPADHAQSGERVGGFYFWLFPNLMLNFYPWGLSVNIVRPVGPTRTRVSFRYYVLEGASRDTGVGSGLHRVEMEDESVVESCQKGVRSRLYDRGRFSPRREVGTHHFHTLLDAALGGEL